MEYETMRKAFLKQKKPTQITLQPQKYLWKILILIITIT